MKVLVLTDLPLVWDYAPASRLLKLAKEMYLDGHEVRVVGSHSDECLYVEGVKLTALSAGAQRRGEKLRFGLRRDLREQVAWCDGLIVRGYWIGLCVLLQAWMMRKSVRIYDFHGYMWKEQKNDGRTMRGISTRILEGMCVVLASEVVAVSEGVASQLPRRFHNKTLILENGVDPDDFGMNALESSDRKYKELGLNPHLPVFSLVGNLGPWIDVAEAVQAFAQLKNDAQLVIVGDGKGRELAQMKKCMIGADNVHILGRQPQEMVKVVLGMSHACICPYSAGWVHAATPNFFASRKVKEYLAAGKVIIVSDITGRGEFLTDGETCVTYARGDPSALKAAVLRVLGDNALVERIANEARARSFEFAWARVYKRSGLDRVLNHNRGCGA